MISSWARARRCARILAALGLLACGRTVFAATVVAGTITDGITAAPVAGAEVRITMGGELLGTGTSDSAGQFRVIFELASQAAVKNLTLGVRHGQYTEIATDVTVSSGRTDQQSYRITLLPSVVGDCRRNGNHTVVVGYFRPPAGSSGQLELASRIKDSLEYDVLARFQKLKIVPQSQPIFIACEQIKPQALADYGSFAKSLGADAFLSGYVVPAGVSGIQKVKVEMSIADRFGLLVPPVHASSLDVDLDDPATARLQGSAQTAIFTALVTGYERAGQTAECVEAANAAEQAIGKLPAVLIETRKRCSGALPNSGLTRGHGP